MNQNKVINAVNLAKAAGITVRCTFMLGNPGETLSTIDETIAYSIKIDPDIALFNITTPYPGTEMFKWAKARGYLMTENWDDYNLGDPVMELPTIKTELLREKYKEAFTRFYVRPKFFLNTLVRMASPKEFPLMLEGVKSLYHFTIANVSR